MLHVIAAAPRPYIVPLRPSVVGTARRRLHFPETSEAAGFEAMVRRRHAEGAAAKAARPVCLTCGFQAPCGPCREAAALTT
jgi:hypothetical protein